MGNLKPFIVPIALSFLGLALQVTKLESDILAVAFYSVAGMLFLFAFVNSKPITRAVHRKFPWLIEWFPILLRDERYIFASPEDLAGPYIRARTFRLTDIAMHGFIKSKTFEECVIVGPAVVSAAPQGGTLSVVGCSGQFRNRIDGFIYDLGSGVLHVMEGTIYVDDCVFRRCEFIRITFACPHDQVEEVRRSINVRTFTPQRSPADPTSIPVQQQKPEPE